MLSLVLVIGSFAATLAVEQSKQPPTDELTVPAGPIEAQNLYRKGRLALKDRRFDDALTHYQRLIKEYSGGDQKHFYYPAGAEAHAAIGDCLLGLKKVREAIDAYTRTENMYPAGSRSQRVRMKLGDCYMELGDYERALVLYKEFRKDWAAVYSRKPMPPEIDGKILNAERMLEEQRKKIQPTKVSRCRRSCNCSTRLSVVSNRPRTVIGCENADQRHPTSSTCDTNSITLKFVVSCTAISGQRDGRGW